MKLFPLLLPIIIITNIYPSGDGRDTDSTEHQFRIRDYVPGTYETKLRSIRLSSDGNIRSDQLDEQRGIEDIRQISNGSAKGLSGGLSYSTRKYFESPRRTLTNRFYLSVSGRAYLTEDTYDYDHQLTELPTEGNHSRDYERNYISFALSRTSRHYNQQNIFIELSPEISAALVNSNSSGDVYTTRIYDDPEVSTGSWAYVNGYNSSGRNKNGRYRAGLKLGIGKGRIYDGSTTWKSQLVIDQLRAQGLDIAQADFIGLADLLYKEQRALYPSEDHVRLSAYSHTEKILNYLEDFSGAGHISPGMVAYIHDILRFTPPIKREFGRSLSLGLEPILIYNLRSATRNYLGHHWNYVGSTIDTSEYDKDSEFLIGKQSLAVDAQINWAEERALDKGWQISNKISLVYQYVENKYDRKSEKIDFADDPSDTSESHVEKSSIERMIWLTARLDIHRIINIRNFITLSAIGTYIPYSKNISESDVIRTSKYQSFGYSSRPESNSLKLEASWNYSLAWNTYLRVTGNGYYRIEDESYYRTYYEKYDRNSFRLGFSVDIRHYF